MASRYIKSVTLFFGVIMACLHCNQSRAELQGIGANQGLLLGLGLVVESSPFEQAENSLSGSPFPYIAYEWENAHAGIDGFSYRFYEASSIQITALLEPRWSLADPDDSPLFAGIERKPSLETGLEVEFELGPLYLSANGLVDISDTHNGLAGQLKIGFEFELGAVSVDFGFGGGFKNQKLNQYLYGVDDDEASDSLAAYKVDDSLHGFLELSIGLPITERLALIGFAHYEAFEEQVKDSPLISDVGESNLGLAILTSF